MVISARIPAGRMAVLLCTLATLGGCDEHHRRPIALTPHGAAVRANMAAQIIDPRPPAVRTATTGAAGPIRAVTAYREGTIAEPAESATAAGTGALE